MNEWQPIETAPKDGTRILAYLVAVHVAPAEWRRTPWVAFWNRYGWQTSPGLYAVDPSHWMPLPDPPK